MFYQINVDDNIVSSPNKFIIIHSCSEWKWLKIVDNSKILWHEIMTMIEVDHDWRKSINFQATSQACGITCVPTFQFFRRCTKVREINLRMINHYKLFSIQKNIELHTLPNTSTMKQWQANLRSRRYRSFLLIFATIEVT